MYPVENRREKNRAEGVGRGTGKAENGSTRKFRGDMSLE
jgi:hypothetical protein